MKEKRAQHAFSDVRFQLAYGIFLMVLIPFLIIFNTVFIINQYNKNTDIALQRQALLLARMFSATTKNNLQDTFALQGILDSVKSSSPDILSLHILAPDSDEFRVVASTVLENINTAINDNYYSIAFHQKENNALATDSVKLAQINGKIGLELVLDEKRFWLVSMPLYDSQKNKIALLSIQMSSMVVDELTNSSWRSSLFSLALSTLIAVLFLAASTRLWGYASLYKKIRQVDAMKDEFISIASHELRTPITAMRGYVAMMLDGSYGKITKNVRSGLERVMISTKRLAGLIEDLLNVSRIEQGRVILNMKSLNPKNVIGEVVGELEPVAREKHLSLEYSSKKSKIENIYVDTDKLKEILLNIVGNGIKYTKHGSVDVSHEIKDYSLEIKVKDTGTGMSAEDQGRLFEKFFRVQNDYTKGVVGTGLGLWITKQLVEMMKGKIYIESMEGVGSQALVIFPLAKTVTIQKK